jgi:cysteine desulfurase
MKPIYLDYAATTPVDARVIAKMQNYLGNDAAMFGNASSPHAYGAAAKHAIDLAREQVASLIHAESSEVIWTSGATEGNNLALKGAAQLYQQKGKHIVTVKTEHPSVLGCCQQLEKEGYSLTYLTPDRNGLLNLTELAAALRDDTILVSIMHVNNEIGVIQDLMAIGKLTSERDILFHVDAVQSAGKVDVDVNAMHIDLLSVSAHKIYGPKGIGALYVRKKPRVRVAAQIHGSGQEGGMRSGTLATHQIVGMGEAFVIAKQEMQNDDKKTRKLRDLFLQQIAAHQKIVLTIDPAHCVPSILNLSVVGLTSYELMEKSPNFAISAGSACGSKGSEPSYVLRGLGLSNELARGCVRISFGRYTTAEDVELLANHLIKIASLGEEN